MTYTDLKTPLVHKDATVNPQIQPKQETVLKTKQAMNCFMQMTSESAQILASPEFSALIQGIKLMGEPSSGFMGGLNQGIGLLMVMASPVWLVVRVGIGLPGTLIGALGTFGSAIGMGVEKTINQIKECPSPSEASLQREHLTLAFVERMKKLLPCFSYPRQLQLRKNPEELVYMGALCVAFLSRNAGAGTLKVGNEDLTLVMLTKQDDQVKEYFRLVNEMKEAINSLQLSDQDQQHAWSYLMTMIENLHNEKLDKLSTIEQETMGLIMENLVKFGQLAISDSFFKGIWKTNFPEFN